MVCSRLLASWLPVRAYFQEQMRSFHWNTIESNWVKRLFSSSLAPRWATAWIRSLTSSFRIAIFGEKSVTESLAQSRPFPFWFLWLLKGTLQVPPCIEDNGPDRAFESFEWFKGSPNLTPFLPQIRSCWWPKWLHYSRWLLIFFIECEIPDTTSVMTLNLPIAKLYLQIVKL